MKLHFRDLTIFEQIQHEIAATAASNKRIATVELTKKEFNEFVKGVATTIGNNSASLLLERGVYSGIAIKVYDDQPDLFETKETLVAAAAEPKKLAKKAIDVLDNIKKRAEKKIIKDKQ